jgi:hypothetical protein
MLCLPNKDLIVAREAGLAWISESIKLHTMDNDRHLSSCPKDFVQHHNGLAALYSADHILDEHIAPDSQDEAKLQYSFHPKQCRTSHRPSFSRALTSTTTKTTSTATCSRTTKSNTSRSRRTHTPLPISMIDCLRSQRVTGTGASLTEIEGQAISTSAIRPQSSSRGLHADGMPTASIIGTCVSTPGSGGTQRSTCPLSAMRRVV